MSGRGESGFTLIEVVIAIPITVVLTAVLAGSLMIGWRTSEVSQLKLAESHDAQLLQFYLTPEIQSVAPSGINTSPGTLCDCSNGSGTDEPGSNVLTLKWAQETFGVTNTYESSYRLIDLDGAGPLPPNQLHRFSCKNGAVAIDKIIAADLSSSSPPVVTIGGAGTPRKVSLKLTKAAGYAFTVEGEWRRSP